MKEEMSNTESDRESIEFKEHKMSVKLSYGIGKFQAEFFTGGFAALVFLYFETEVGLKGWLTALGIVIYSIWNAINDPLIGFLTEKPTPLAKKWGRRFPWIIFGSIFWVFSFILIFAVPQSLIDQDIQWALFLWMVASTCLYDLLFTTWEVNYQSTFPDKFRNEKERNSVAGVATFIGVFGIAAGALVPTFIVNYGVKTSYVRNSVIFSLVGIIMVVFLISGVREDPDMINRYLEAKEQEKETQTEEPFFVQLFNAFKHKNFLAFILLYFFYQAGVMSMNASVHYVGKYILFDVSKTTVIFAAMLVGALISIPIWLYVAKKIQNNQKSLTIASLLIAASSFPMTFLNTQLGFSIALGLWGMAFGGFWLTMTPAMADVIDEIVVKTERRNDGIFLGFRAFFGRLSYAVQAISFWIIHALTGFDQHATLQSDTAILGIKIHLAILPSLLVLVGTFIFWKLNDLDKEKVQANKAKLAEIQL